MKVIKDEIATLRRRRRVTIELDHGEHLMAFHEDRHYRLGCQLDDVIAGHHITETNCVTWCSIAQRWVA